MNMQTVLKEQDGGRADARLSIGALARATGLGVETIRFYEREALLPEPERSASNYRKYGDDALRRLRFIRRAKELGFTLQEIRKLLTLSSQAHAHAGDFKVMALGKIGWIDRQIAELQQMRGVLAGAIDACPGHGPKEQCPILKLFSESEEA
jgi:MerR family copper efflux transcriptional regulator